MTAKEIVAKRQRIAKRISEGIDEINEMVLVSEHGRLFSFADIETKAEIIRLEGDVRSDDFQTLSFQDMYDLGREFGFSLDYLIIDTINNLVKTKDRE